MPGYVVVFIVRSTEDYISFLKLTALYKLGAPGKSPETSSFIKVGAWHQNSHPPSGKAFTP
jgi:hypothetical protein